ncbi:hypothetical protein FB45DRAFT_907310, partial [Roridomyces roridus]
MITTTSLPALPAELWMLIHRVALPDIAPSYDLASTNPLAAGDMKEYLQAVCHLVQVCRSWNALAHHLLYENVWVNGHFDSLAAAVAQPETARLVRRIRLSTTRLDHNDVILRLCRQVALIVHPGFKNRARPFDTAAQPSMENMRALHWVQTEDMQYRWYILNRLLEASPNLSHLSLSTTTCCFTHCDMLFVPTLPNLTSLSLSHIRSFYVQPFFARGNEHLPRLTSLAIASHHIKTGDVTPFPSLRTLKLLPEPATDEVPFSAIFELFPNLCELQYDVRSRIDYSDFRKPEGLECVRLCSPIKGLCHFADAHFRLFMGPAFSALRRVVLDASNWDLEWLRGNCPEYRVLGDELRRRGGGIVN